MVKWTYLPAKNLLLPIIGLMASWSSHNYHKIIFSLIYIPIWISKRNISIFLQIKRPRTNKNWQADHNIFSAADRRGNEGFCGVDVILGPNNQKYLVMWKFRFKHIIHGIFFVERISDSKLRVFRWSVDENDWAMNIFILFYTKFYAVHGLIESGH